MKSKTLLSLTLLTFFVFGCSKNIEYSEQFKKDTAGNYLYNPDDIIEIYYKNDKLQMNWRGGEFQPVALSENEFFVADMYSKFRFVQHPETKKRYLSTIPENNEDSITYDYVKVSKGYKTPSKHLEEGNYQKALAGFLEIKKEDSTSVFIEERDFNRIGYKHLRNNEIEKAIGVFNLNAELHPKSSNAYDSLAEAYLLNNDSLQAYNNYKKALSLNTHNERVRNFLNNFKDQ